MYKLIKIFEIKTTIDGVIYKNVLDLYLKSEKILILWKKHFMKSAKKKFYDRYIRTKRPNKHSHET